METKRECADAILRELFATRKRVAIAEVVAAGKARNVSRRTLLRAANDMGISMVHNGPYGGFWEKS